LLVQTHKDGGGQTTQRRSSVTMGAKILMLVENESLPADTRVWAECLVLREAGFEIVGVSPQGRAWDRDQFEYRDGIAIHRFPASYASGSLLSYIAEYWHSFWHVLRLSRVLQRQHRFSAVHAANPPDFLLIAAWPLKRKATRFIFDHHDLAPELYLTRFGGGRRFLYWVARALERVSFQLADVVIATNESYRSIAMTRGRKCREDVFVVRNAPDLSLFRPGPPDSTLKRGKAHLITYVGNMAPQDGVDHAVRALAILRQRREDWHAVFVGGGDSAPEIQRLALQLGLDDLVEFTGFLRKPDVVRILTTSDVCLAPEPRTAINDASTMIKIAEYMAMERPIVAYDLTESRFTAGPAALYATANDPAIFAGCIDQLLSDPERRAEMGEIGRARVEAAFSWDHSARNLLAAYDRALQL
jgi:glycosyltransferase involved in cell wall biosynthesis